MLVERLMGLADDGVTEDQSVKIPVHTFFAAVGEVVHNRLTGAQVRAFWDIQAGDTDWSNLAAQMPPGSALAARALYLEAIHGAFLLAEVRMPGYATPAEVRAKLGI